MTNSEARPHINIAVAGADPEAERWLRALRGVEDTAAEQTGLSDDDLLRVLSGDRIDAVVFAGETPDLPGAVKRALMANRHVLVAGATAISSKQLLAFDTLARRRNRIIVFDTGAFADERVDFVRKMTVGPQALWRPRYVRSLRTGADTRHSLDELAIADIAFVLGLIGGAPSRISAVSPRVDDESGAADVAMITLMFDGGSSARIDVSLIEPEPRHEVAIVCDGRTLLLDAYNARAPLQIQASAHHRGPQHGQWGETVSEHPNVELADRLARAAEAFAAAVRSRDVEASNARTLASAVTVWEAARASITAAGEMIDIDGAAAEPQRPALKLIVGGGHSDASYPAPELTLVGRRAAEPEPLESA